MTKPQKISIEIVVAVAVIAIVATVIGVFIFRAARPTPLISLTGDVVKQDDDPTQQTPLSGVTVTAVLGSSTVTTRSGPSGLFYLTLKRRVQAGQTVVLTFEHPNYKTLKITTTHPGDQLYIARLQQLQPQEPTTSNPSQALKKMVQISNVRVRYTLKEESTVEVGSLAKQFTAHNVGNIPCRSRPPCSPDGRWAAATTTLALDAEDDNQFRNVRILCVAGPCAFTKILSPAPVNPERKITVSVLNWSDTTNFLVEADVIRTMVADSVRYAYPFVVGQTMNYGLPPLSEGPSVEADLDGQYIVFPLGPDLILDWATCSVEVSHEGNRIYRCQLKPGYRFQE